MSFLAEFDALPTPEARKGLMLSRVRTQPFETFADLREHRPILSVAGTVLVTRFGDVQEVMERNAIFTVRPYAPKMDPSVGPYMLARDDTQLNDRDKGIMRSILRREDLPDVRKIASRLASQAIDDGTTSNGELEVVSNLSRKVPLQLTGDYFGFPGPSLESMMRWSRATQFDMFHNQENIEQVHQDSVRAGQEMKAYLGDLVARRRKELAAGSSADDTLTRLLRSTFPDAVGFDEERVIANLMGLLVGGTETTSAAIVQILDELLSRPDELAGAQAAAADGDDELLASYCWEALRFQPQAPFVVRLCVADYTVASGSEHATRVKAGEVVLASMASGMRDALELEQPEAFRTNRPDYHYMHFGYGNHTCLGDHVARVMIPETVKQLIGRKGFRRTDGPGGRIDFEGGPFPESLVVGVAT